MNRASYHRFPITIEVMLSNAAGPRLGPAIYEFLVFGLKQAASCVFAGSFLFLLAISGHVSIPGLARYDFLFLGAIAIQIVLVAVRLENWREVAVLSLFHLIGMGLELFKTSPSIRSWSYPEPAFFHLKTVPLYSGFMYASVASYIMQSWRLMQVEAHRIPTLSLGGWTVRRNLRELFYQSLHPRSALASCGLRAGALPPHAGPFHRDPHRRRMPLALSFLLIGFFIWVAENIATYFGAWQYPHQKRQWAIVGPTKISSWMLLVIISFIIVAALKEIFPKKQEVFGTEEDPAMEAAAQLD